MASLDPDDFNAIVELVCPICRRGVARRHRPETNEWVHDEKTAVTFRHSICWATGLLTSRYNPENRT